MHQCSGVQAVVFDFDGVIVQSLEQHARAYAEVLNPLGGAVQERDVLLREGARSETIIQDLLSDAGVTITADNAKQLADEKQAAFLKRGVPRLYDAARPMLEAVWATGTPTAIVTGTRRTNLDAIIPDLVGRFDAIVTQESYSQDKPHPEPYLTAAQHLDIPPAQCIGVENAIRGVQSAKAAGYGRVIAVCTTLAASDLLPTEPDVLAADHEGVTQAILEALA